MPGPNSFRVESIPQRPSLTRRLVDLRGSSSSHNPNGLPGTRNQPNVFFHAPTLTSSASCRSNAASASASGKAGVELVPMACTHSNISLCGSVRSSCVGLCCFQKQKGRPKSRCRRTTRAKAACEAHPSRSTFCLAKTTPPTCALRSTRAAETAAPAPYRDTRVKSTRERYGSEMAMPRFACTRTQHATGVYGSSCEKMSLASRVEGRAGSGVARLCRVGSTGSSVVAEAEYKGAAFFRSWFREAIRNNTNICNQQQVKQTATAH
mmetsp:Transcript_29036/g.60934  ORF Transcript_29036/g.60934 Transcript_29036/m.60934 type:complete len:265 (+) Transcript_29036:356-1150(+)